MHFLKQNTEHKQQLKSKVLDVAKRMFLEKGVKAVKMDDISGVLSISKRTLYEIYGNKEDLLLEVLHLMKKECMEKFLEVSKENSTVIDDFISFCKFQTEFMKNLSPAFITDLQKYPKAQEHLTAHNEEARQHALSFFKRGVKEGFFLPGRGCCFGLPGRGCCFGRYGFCIIPKLWQVFPFSAPHRADVRLP